MRPLAERMRPKSLDEFMGQEHLTGPDAVLRKSIETGQIHSFILWGPPGVGKTTIATIIANQLKVPYYALSAINSGVKDVRETIQKVEKSRFFDQTKAILFIDEIHRFSKSQQDSLLNAVEKGIITLIGATTENPSFEVIPALLSRCQVYVLEHLNKTHLEELLNNALQKDEFLSNRKIEIKEYEALLKFSGGDGRKLLNGLEIVCTQNKTEDDLIITNDLVKKSIHSNINLYDKNGELHYDIISAFIKSIRGSDPNAAVYYLARMIEGGEDPKFICRRLIILASEDIGLANPNALLIANACMQSIQTIGMPEGRIIMSQTAIYLACCPKSNASYMAINLAQAKVKESGNLTVPLALRNAPTKLMKELGYGTGYKYAHNYENGISDQEFMPDQLIGEKFFEPGTSASEEKLRAVLRKHWKEKYGY